MENNNISVQSLKTAAGEMSIKYSLAVSSFTAVLLAVIIFLLFPSIGGYFIAMGVAVVADVIGVLFSYEIGSNLRFLQVRILKKKIREQRAVLEATLFYSKIIKELSTKQVCTDKEVVTIADLIKKQEEKQEVCKKNLANLKEMPGVDQNRVMELEDETEKLEKKLEEIKIFFSETLNQPGLNRALDNSEMVHVVEQEILGYQKELETSENLLRTLTEK